MIKLNLESAVTKDKIVEKIAEKIQHKSAGHYDVKFEMPNSKLLEVEFYKKVPIKDFFFEEFELNKIKEIVS